MKLNLSYDEAMIKELIQLDLERKLNVKIDAKDLKILVQSKQNYRVHDWETGKLKCDLEVNI
jgi:hypothetical protein